MVYIKTFLSAYSLLLILPFYVQRSSVWIFPLIWFPLFHLFLWTSWLFFFLTYVYGYRVCACALLRVKYVVKYHLDFVKQCIKTQDKERKALRRHVGL